MTPRVEPGDVVLVERVDARNKAWFFGQDSRGVAGFFPLAWFEVDGDRALAKRGYDAAELTVAADQLVAVQEAHGRWLLVAIAGGGQGWIPQECVE